MEKSEALQSSRTFWKVLGCLGFFLFFAGAEPAAAESVPGTIGNYSGTPSGSSGLGFNGQTSAGTIRRLKQKFSVTASALVSNLNLPIWQQGSPTGNLTVKLCSAAGDTLSDPCVQTLVSGTYSLASLPTTRAAAFAAPTELPMPNGFTLYPGVTYVVVLERDATADTNITRIAFTAADVYPVGSVWNDLKVCANGWYRTESTASSCSGTEWSGYDMFFGFETSGGSLTLSVNLVGETVYAFGECVEPADLPSGWQLFSNQVSITYTDSSASGTWLLQEAECDDGFYSTSSDPMPLWNAAWEAEAVQDGDPQRFTASATFTMEGSSVVNPVAGIITECPRDESFFTCAMRTWYVNVLANPPFSWFSQLRGALEAEPDGLEDGAWRSATNTMPVLPDWDAVSSLGDNEALRVRGQTIVSWDLRPDGSSTGTWAVAATYFNFRGYLVWVVWFQYLAFVAWFINRLRNAL